MYAFVTAFVAVPRSQAVTGERDAVSMARALLAGPGSRLEWVVVKQGGRGSTLVTRSSRAVVHRPGFKVRFTLHRSCQATATGSDGQ